MLIWSDPLTSTLDDITTEVINWRTYHEPLVRRGKVILGFDIIENRKNELYEMNQGKEGVVLYRYLVHTLYRLTIR